MGGSEVGGAECGRDASQEAATGKMPPPHLHPPVPPPHFLPRSCLGAAPWASSVLGKVEPKALGWTRCLGTRIQPGCAWPAMGC